MLEAIEIIGVFVFAVSGALVAVRRGFDAVGIVTLAVITALGGGLLRDVLIGATPPAAFTDWPLLTAAIAAAFVTFFFHPALERMALAILIFDAAGLGLFSVVGAVKALDYGVSPLAAAALGVTTGVGGGVLRDVVARETPMLVRPDSELYAVPAIGGSLVVALLWSLDSYRPVWGAAVAVGIIAVRLLALRYRWRAPTAVVAREQR